MMKTLIEKIDCKNNELEFVKSKNNYPEIFNLKEIELDIIKLKNQIKVLKKEIEEIIDIKNKRKLIFDQLSDYIEILKIEYEFPFSKSQGLSYDKFYISPLLDFKNILFFDLIGTFGVILNLTLNNKDSVTDKLEFLNLLIEKRIEIQNGKNLYDLYIVYKSFEKEIKTIFLQKNNITEYDTN